VSIHKMTKKKGGWKAAFFLHPVL